MKKGKNNGYYVSYSMHSLGLTGAEIMTYALISTFTRSVGMFFGSVDYISDRLQLSKCSVKRAISSLKKKGYVKAVKEKEYNGLVAIDPTDEAGDATVIAEKGARGGPATEEAPLYTEGSTAPDSSSRGRGKAGVADCQLNLLSLGVYKNVTVTAEQYAALCEMLDEKIIDGYIDRLSIITKSRSEDGAPPPNNSYAIIKKWIKEDYSV